MCCTHGGESVGGREHAGTFQGGSSWFSEWCRGPLIPPYVSCFFAWLSLGQVVDDSVMVWGLPSGVVPSYL